MANAFVPDDKRRHLYMPMEEPPGYHVPTVNESSSGTSTRRRSDRHHDESGDELDALGSDNEHDGHADPHRPDSEDSLEREFQDLELDEEEPGKEPIHVRISREFHRITARVDQVLYRYVNASVMRYIYGAILGLLVLIAVYIFGGSIPTLEMPNSYAEGALRIYINEELSSERIKFFFEQATNCLSHHPVEQFVDRRIIADWLHNEFAALGVARNAIDSYAVYYPAPVVDGFNLSIGDEQISLYQDDRLKSFITHGAQGNGTGQLVYINEGKPSDFSWLHENKVALTGAVFLVRHNASISLAAQVMNAQAAGAKALLVYPSQYDSTAIYPDGPHPSLDTSLVLDAAATWIQPGDPLTPGVPSRDNVEGLDPDTSDALPRIPVFSISTKDAANLHQVLASSNGISNDAWNTGTSEQHIAVGDADFDAAQTIVTFDQVLDTERKHMIHNVLSEIEGSESDQVLVIGTSLGSPSNVAVLLEISRIFADLVTKYKWRPRRSLIFAAWDGSEANFLGSTEWAEAQTKSLRRQGIAYINLDNVASLSSELEIFGTPSLTYALLTAMSYVNNSFSNNTLADEFGSNVILPIHKFSDSTAFSSHIGTSVVDIGYPVSNVDRKCLRSSACIEQYIDPNFTNHAVLGKFLSTLILALIDDRFVQLDLHQLARSIEESLQSLGEKYPSLDLGGDLRHVLQELDSKTDLFMQFMNEWSQAFRNDKNTESQVMATKRMNWNYAVSIFHRNLLRSSSWTTWFENAIYGPGQYQSPDGTRTWEFPHIEDYLSQGEVAKAQGSLIILGETLIGATKALVY